MTLDPLYDLCRRWPWTTAWILYVAYVTTVFYIVGALR
jgi:hypothetical protein